MLHHLYQYPSDRPKPKVHHEVTDNSNGCGYATNVRIMPMMVQAVGHCFTRVRANRHNECGGVEGAPPLVVLP